MFKVIIVVILFFAIGVAMALVARLSQNSQKLADLHRDLKRNSDELDRQRRELERRSAELDARDQK